MPQSYQLAQTFAPAPDFDERLAALDLSVLRLCSCTGITASTYGRMQRLRTVSRKTAQRIASGFALAHGGINPQTAFSVLFIPLPRVVMDSNPCGRTFHRRNDP